MKNQLTTACNRVCERFNRRFRTHKAAVLDGYPMQVGALEATLFTVCNAVQFGTDLESVQKNILRILGEAEKPRQS